MIQLGDYVIDGQQLRLLEKNNYKEVPIEPKLLALLLFFVEQPNVVISRQALLDHLWTGSVVTDNAINKLIGNLRKVLGDDAKHPRYIQTVPKRGYRLVCSVSTIAHVDLQQENINTVEESNSANHRLKDVPKTRLTYAFQGIFAVFLLALLGAVAWELVNEEGEADKGYSIALTRAQGIESSPYMHPDNVHLYYLKGGGSNASFELWQKNLHTAAKKRITLQGNISQIIAVVEMANGNRTKLLYLERTSNFCGVYQAIFASPLGDKHEDTSRQKLFDCSDKRVKDVDYHEDQQVIYYTAQPKNYWPNQIYSFDLETHQHKLVTQGEPVGWGHHGIDISPDGEKLLIMSTKSDHNTQLLSLNLQTNEITEGMKFDRPIYEAIWHHDSEQVYFYSPPPAHQIIKSDFDGKNASAIISVSESLSPRMVRVPDDKNLLFSTERKNFNNRWLAGYENTVAVDNSSVIDRSPAILHGSNRYIFASERSGRMQLYMADNQSTQARIISNFTHSYPIGYMSISGNNQKLLLSIGNKVYCLPMNELSAITPITTIKQEYLMYTSSDPIISIDWFTEQGIAITAVKNGNPELIVVDLFGEVLALPKGQWAFGFMDSEHPKNLYLIAQQSNLLYHAFSDASLDNTSLNLSNLTNMQIALPSEFYHAKLDNNALYYVLTESESEFLHIVPLDNQLSNNKLLLNDFSSYDVSLGKIMVSDMDSREGDIHRTMYE